ncbi:MAG TPA: hypothetical protein VJ692_11455, partial [Nitrospiraceae bacterium]|nr:hypothetical protein [Nitrospiraceae bacterium]
HGSSNLYDELGAAVARTVDLEEVEAFTASCGELDLPAGDGACVSHHANAGRLIKVGVAYDPAFCFYYPENLELLEAEGAEIIKFSPLQDSTLPPVDLLYLGGGYPELYGEQLANNVSMRRTVHDFARDGGPIYAECGGMMYLTQAIVDFDGRSHDMVGVFPCHTVMNKGLTMGYREIEVTRSCLLGHAGLKVRGHEFHYSSLVLHGGAEYACRSTDARGGQGGPDGLISDNTVALYTHLHFASRPDIARTLLASARKVSRGVQF